MKRILLILLLLSGAFSLTAQVKYYLTAQAGQPWGSNSNINDMNLAFGVGIWNQGYFETINANALFQPSVCMIYLDGSASNANSLNNFLSVNLTALQTWVFNGGRAFLNAAPLQGGNINFGFGGTTLNYNTGPYTYAAYAAPGMTNLPVFTTPYIGGINYNGNTFGNGYVTSPDNVAVLTSTNGNMLQDRYFGSGHIYFGAEATANWQNPAPQADNFRANILYSLGSCCSTSLITVNAALSSTSICSGQNVTITPSGGFGGPYSLWPGGTSGTVFVVSPTVTTNYNVVSTSSVGCEAGITIKITFNPGTVPTLSISGGTTVCSGSAVNFTANGASTYSWSTGAITNTMSNTAFTNTFYTVSGTATNGCVGNQTQSVNVNPPPTLTTPGNVFVCTGQSATLNVNGASSYTWSNGSNASSIVITPTANINYTVAGTSSLGCSSLVPDTIKVTLVTCLGLKRSTALSELKVFPNPSSGELFIEGAPLGKLELFDQTGSLVLSRDINSEKIKLDLSSFARGIYFIKLSGAEGYRLVKVVKVGGD